MSGGAGQGTLPPHAAGPASASLAAPDSALLGGAHAWDPPPCPPPRPAAACPPRPAARLGASPAENLRGAATMTASMLGFACSDACLKLLGESLPLFQILALRGVGTTLVLALAGAAGRGVLARHRRGATGR